MQAVKGQEFINTLFPFVVIVFIIAVGVVLLYQHFQKNLFAERLKRETLKGLHQAALLRATIQAQEEERKRIAQDLHDELGAVLSIMRMHMVVLEQQSRQMDSSLSPGLLNVRSLAETALANVRSISHSLLPPQLEAFGIVKTLEAVTGQINSVGATEVRFNIPVSLESLPWDITLGLYRIIMELINNTLKHAEATVVEIEILLDNRYVICRYSDNGKGISETDAPNGLGHKNINARINVMSGTFEFGSSPTGGFNAMVKIPVATGAGLLEMRQ